MKNHIIPILFLFALAVFAQVPTVTTRTPFGILDSSAQGGGEVTSIGGSALTHKGVCWNTTGAPTIANSKTEDVTLIGIPDYYGTGTGKYRSSLIGLDPETKYYIRAYATNGSGTAYGALDSFTTIATSSMEPCTCYFNGDPPCFWEYNTQDFDCPWVGGAPSNYPNIWTKQFVSGTTNWVQYAGVLYGDTTVIPPRPDSGYGGHGYNALFYQEDWSEPETRLISPIFVLDPGYSYVVSFWAVSSEWDFDMDGIGLYYSTDTTSGTWTLIDSFGVPYDNPDVPLTIYYHRTWWTKYSFDLPNPSSQYRFAFQGYAYYGYGFGLDDVDVYCITTPLVPDTVTWTGAVSTSWSLAGNWSPPFIPDSTTDAIINLVANQPLVDCAAECKNITLKSGVVLSFSGANVLTVFGDFYNDTRKRMVTGNTIKLNSNIIIADIPMTK